MTAALDPIPLPAPVWLLHALLIATFLMHVIPMSVTLGGGFWAIMAARRAGADPAMRDLAGRVGHGLPYWAAATVTTGVAALLFLQTLYGHLFYAAAVAIAWPWLAVVGLVLIGYYGYYFRAFRFAASPGTAFVVGLVAWLAFVVVAFIYTNQMTLMLRPDRIMELHVADPTGASLNLGETTLWPRYLHMLFGAIGIAALWVAYLGVRALGRGDDEAAGRRILSFGVHGFLGFLLLQAAVGLWFLLALPQRQWLLFTGGDGAATAYFVLSLLFACAAAWLVWRSRDAGRPRARLLVGAGHILAVVFLMLLMRDVLRRDTLGAAAGLAEVQVAPQWGAIVMFLVLLVLGIGAVAWMLLAIRRSPGPEAGD